MCFFPIVLIFFRFRRWFGWRWRIFIFISKTTTAIIIVLFFMCFFLIVDGWIFFQIVWFILLFLLLNIFTRNWNTMNFVLTSWEFVRTFKNNQSRINRCIWFDFGFTFCFITILDVILKRILGVHYFIIFIYPDRYLSYGYIKYWNFLRIFFNGMRSIWVV